MASNGVSLELLAHFDSHQLDEAARQPVGVIGVLKWAAAAGVLFFAACLLLAMTYCIAAERSLSQAARAGAVEATLPRATRQSIVATIERRLLSKSISTAGLHIHVHNNNDQVSVATSIPANEVLPAWLNAIPFCRGGVSIEGHAKQSMPARRLPPY
jgi:hypothetical protein